MTDYIVLIRRRPSPGTADGLVQALRKAVQEYGSAMVFFHGDGVEAPSGWPAATPGIDWCVCRTSFERRSAGNALPPPFRVATLMTFYQGVVSARRVDSLGLGGALCCRAEAGDRAAQDSGNLLLEIGFAPADQRQRRETLEMALGAAALGLNASIFFHGDGLAHLVEYAARGWAQITDFDLLGMYAEAAARPPGPEIAVQTLDRGQAVDLRARAGTILIL